MMTANTHFAWLRSIEEPQLALSWSLDEWQRVVRLGRRTRLLARIADSLDASGLLGSVPAEPQRHLIADLRVSRHRTAAVLWGIDRVGAILEPTGVTRVLLKGAAYLGQDLPIAHGRMPSDLDILVPVGQLEVAQKALVEAGWVEAPLDAHDQRYYREWSHELPPMRHVAHGVELDLHHNIVPPVSKTPVDASLLLERLLPSRWPGWFILDPVDQLLHCAAHMFADAELKDRVRDVVDFAGLWARFCSSRRDQQAFAQRALQLGLGRQSLLILAQCKRMGVAPTADEVVAALSANVGQCRGLSRVVTEALGPVEPDERPGVLVRVSSALIAYRYARWRFPVSLAVSQIASKVRR